MLSEHLVTSGMEVDFWTSNFDHTSKRFRRESAETVTIGVSEGYRIHLLPSSGYKRHISLARVFDHRKIAKSFSAAATAEPRPDLLVISMPTIDLAHAGARFAVQHGIPYILDLRDLWPEIFYMDRPAPLRQAIRLLTMGWSRQLNWALRHADALVGITEAFVDWGCARSGRTRRPKVDQALPLAYPPAQAPTQEEDLEQQRLQTSEDLRPDLFQLCFLGAISNRMDLSTLCQAVLQRNRRAGPPLHLVVAGSGEILDELKKAYASPNIRFLGRVNQPALRAILRTSRVGIVPYRNSLDFRMSIPNKAIEYLSYGLPILTSLRGVLADLIQKEGLGALYEEGSPDSLECQLDLLQSNPSILAASSRKALQTAQRYFSTDVVLDKYLTLIQSQIHPQTCSG